MPKLFTNSDRKPSIPDTKRFNACTNSYESYLEQRVLLDDFSSEKLTSLTKNYQTLVIDKFKELDPTLEFGQYFVIPVQEIKKMLAAEDDNADFIHICFAVRQTTNSKNELISYPVTILVPVKKTIDTDGEPVHEYCKSEKSTYIEAFPCPPDRRCPKTVDKTNLIYDADTQINDFKSLI
ncbi:MAG: hypothetical protein CFE25_05410 [Chitinophagaceae bacterium BSSC1]|nr:MAG: hypothetical protein CFE25_05410 [Chitinophagaceae bacterium BSSC1]